MDTIFKFQAAVSRSAGELFRGGNFQISEFSKPILNKSWSENGYESCPENGHDSCPENGHDSEFVLILCLEHILVFIFGHKSCPESGHDSCPESGHALCSFWIQEFKILGFPFQKWTTFVSIFWTRTVSIFWTRIVSIFWS